MSVLPSGSGVAARLAPAETKTRGFLHIDRHGGGPQAIYVVTYHRLDENHIRPKPVLAEGAQALIELLERIGVDFRLKEVRGALEDILRLGSANIPDLWLTHEEMVEKGLVEQ
jgi:predicted ThiF/HesA family dinucleotide-utilizing enzyme